MVIKSEREAAQMLGVSVRSLQRWRRQGGGPKFCRLGARRLGYPEDELQAWAKGNTFSSRAAELAQHAA